MRVTTRVLAGSLLLLAASVLAACGGSTPSPAASASAATTAPATAAPTEAPPATPEVTPTPAPTPKPLAMTLVDRTKVVHPGDMASVTVETKAGADCEITVTYESGTSEAAGLGDKQAKAKADGRVTWKWMVGTNAYDQKVDVSVRCQLNDRVGTLGTVINVK